MSDNDYLANMFRSYKCFFGLVFGSHRLAQVEFDLAASVPLEVDQASGVDKGLCGMQEVEKEEGDVITSGRISKY